MSAERRDGATLPPSQLKLRKARERGEGPRSRQSLAVAAALGALGGLALALPGALSELRALLSLALEGRGEPAWREALSALLAASAAAGLGAATAAFLVGALDGGLRPRLRASIARLDPLRGLGRLFGRERLSELGFTLARAAVLAVAGAVALGGALGTALEAALRSGLRGAAAATLGLLLRGAGGLLAAHLALAGLERWVEHRRFLRRMRMTRQEVRQEQREEDGDPAMRAERRRRQRQLALAPGLHGASVLVVNPTHAAAALRYQPGEDQAPVLLAAGVGEAAARLRAEASRLGVPFVRHVALARALQRLSPGEMIPEGLYLAAAEVLRAVAGALGPAGRGGGRG